MDIEKIETVDHVLETTYNVVGINMGESKSAETESTSNLPSPDITNYAVGSNIEEIKAGTNEIFLFFVKY